MFYFNTIDRNKAFLLKTCFNFDCIDLDDGSGADASHWSVRLPSRYQINQQKAKWDSNGAASDVSTLYQ